MKTIKIAPFILTLGLMIACNNNSKSTNNATSPGVNDTTSTNPTTNATDYHPDESQHIPATDSSNTIGTDTINSSESTPNTGTAKTYNNKKGSKDSTHK
jgi:hypothetical protein